MPRCVSDADAKRPCTKRATQRALARFVNPLTASKMRSTMPSASRSHHPTSGHAAQEQRQLPHAIAMATHTAHGISDHEHKSSCGLQLSVVAIKEAAHGSSPRPRRAPPAPVSAHQAAWQPGAALAPPHPTQSPRGTDGRLRRPTVGAALGRPPKSNPTESGDATYITPRGTMRRSRPVPRERLPRERDIDFLVL